MRPIVDLNGKTFGRLTVVQYLGIQKTRMRQYTAWLCRCECGGEKIVFGRNLTAGFTKSCGCLDAERVAAFAALGAKAAKERWAAKR